MCENIITRKIEIAEAILDLRTRLRTKRTRSVNQTVYVAADSFDLSIISGDPNSCQRPGSWAYYGWFLFSVNIMSDFGV